VDSQLINGGVSQSGAGGSQETQTGSPHGRESGSE